MNIISNKLLNHKKRALVVDDNENLAKVVGITMEEIFGYDVKVELDGIKAIESAKNFLPDIILMDIGLEGMDGYQTCRLMRQEPTLKDTIIIAQTGWGEESHRLRSLEAGFDYHLVKPVSIETLKELLDSPDFYGNTKKAV
jgi:CheY-like chemotaxis protein